MIKKLYNLKKTQTDQKILQRTNLQNKVYEIEEQVSSLKDSIVHTTVNRYGPISDFAVLEIHKATMKENILKLELEKSKLLQQITNTNKEIVELQKESEQFNYILTQEKKEKMKKFLKDEDAKADEYMQTKMVLLMKGN